jgi:restriction endonuclease S subunit
MKTFDDILIDYPEYLDDADKFENKLDLIDTIIFDRSMIKNVSNKVEEVNTVECQKYKPSNEVVWELSENDTDNIKYKEQFSKLQKVIDNVHQYMFNNNQINGITAMRDMMKILPIIILKDYFTSEEFSKEIDKLDLSQKNKELYKKFVLDIKTISKEDNPLNKFKLFIQNCISKILPDIFKEGDGTFEFNKSGKGDKTFIYMIQEFSNLKVDKDFKDGFACSCGDIHELFRKYAGKKEAKDFGGFNTPRHALNMIYDFDSIKQLINERMSEDTSIFDPTMGTAGFLTRFFNLFTMNAENIYGCELSPDTIKFAFVSLYLTSGKILKNLESCNSLSESDNIFKKHIIGLANPPFGTSIKYKKYTTGKGTSKQTFDGEIETFIKFHMKDKYDTEEDKKEDEEKYKKLFKEIYPIETNTGACLFTQHFVYKLENNGLGIIILPDGEIFDGNSQWSKTFRKWLLNNVNIKMIIKMPQGTFEHAGVKTNVLVFIKNGKTENIQYFDTTKECNVVKELFTITEEDFKSTNYSLDMSDYLEEEETNFEVPMVKLGDICELKNGDQLDKKNIIPGEIPIYGGGKKLVGYHNVSNREGGEIIVCGTGSCGLVKKCDTPFWASQCFTIKTIKDNLDNDYLYFISKYYLEEIFMVNKKGVGQPYIRASHFVNTKIPLPSLEIQGKIVKELSMIETNIKSIETRIEQLKEEKERFKKYSRKSEIKELLKDAEIKKINEVMKVTGGKGENDRSKVETDEYNIPYYDSNGITSYVKNSLYDGEYIITARKMSIGSVHFVKGKYYSSDNTINITSMNGDTTLNTYFYYWLKFNNDILINMSSGIKPGIRMGEVRLLKIPVPSPEIQEQCIQIYKEKESFINSIDDKIDSEKNYINELKNLTKDIIHSYC